jgi:hypothetical protein
LGGWFGGSAIALIINPIFNFVTIIVYLKISRFFGRYPTMFEKWVSKGFRFMIIGEVLLILDGAITYSLQPYLSHYIFRTYYSVVFNNLFNSIFIITSILFHCLILYGLYLIIIGMAYYRLDPSSDEFKNLKIGYKYHSLKNPFIPINFKRVIIIISGMSFSIGYLIIVLQGIMTNSIEFDEMHLLIQLLSFNIFLIVLYFVIIIITLYYYKISEFFSEGKNRFEINFSLGFRFIVIGMVLYFIVNFAFFPTFTLYFFGLDIYSDIYFNLAIFRAILNIIYYLIIIYGTILLARSIRYYQQTNRYFNENKSKVGLKISKRFDMKRTSI